MSAVWDRIHRIEDSLGPQSPIEAELLTLVGMLADRIEALSSPAREQVVWADEASPFTGAQVKALLEENERLRQAVGPTKLPDRVTPPWNTPRRFWCDECASARGVDRAVEACRRETIEACAARVESHAATWLGEEAREFFARSANLVRTIDAEVDADVASAAAAGDQSCSACGRDGYYLVTTGLVPRVTKWCCSRLCDLHLLGKSQTHRGDVEGRFPRDASEVSS